VKRVLTVLNRVTGISDQQGNGKVGRTAGNTGTESTCAQGTQELPNSETGKGEQELANSETGRNGNRLRTRENRHHSSQQVSLSP